MKESNYKSYDKLPLLLNAATMAKVLGIAPSGSYELMHEKVFLALRIGKQIVVPKEVVRTGRRSMLAREVGSCVPSVVLPQRTYRLELYTFRRQLPSSLSTSE